MTAKLYVKKSVIILLMIGLFAGAVLSVFFTLKNRFELADKSEKYIHILGNVVGIDEHESSDDESDHSTYTVTVGYRVDGEVYYCSTDDDYSEYVWVGDEMDVMYRTDDPADSYIAGKDFFTGKYLPYDSTSPIVIFIAGLLISFAMIFLAFIVGNSRAQVLLIGFGLLLMGLSGIFEGIAEGNSAMFFLIIFGAAGLLILFGNGFKSKKKREELQSADLHLFTVIGVSDNDLGGITVFFSEGIGNLRGAAFSYNTYNREKFSNGAKFQIDMNKIDLSSRGISYNGYSTIDISYIPEDAFKEVNKIMKKIINLAENNVK